MFLLRPLGSFCFRDAGSGCLDQHIQKQLQVTHVLPQIFLFQPLELLVLPGGHTGPSTGNLVGELVADTDDQQALVDPLFLFSIPGGADLLIFKKLDLVATLFLIHDMFLPG